MILSAAWHILHATTVWAGVKDVQWLFNPFNVAGCVVNLLLVSPALLAFWWADRKK
jgi:hypothetical protein